MKNIQQFESFDPEAKTALDAVRFVNSKKPIKILMHVLSALDDLLHLDAKSFMVSIKNRDGFRKLNYIFSELTLLKELLDDHDIETRDELEEYDFDIDKILKYLNDDVVISYLNDDLRANNRLKNLDELIVFLEDL